MVGAKGGAEGGHAVAQGGGVVDGDVGAPGDEVPADLFEAAGGEADRQ